MNRTTLITVCTLATLVTLASGLYGATPPQTAPAGVTAERNRQWQDFNAESGQRWIAEWNRDTGLPRRISGHRLELGGAVGKDSVESLSRQRLAGLSGMLGIDLEQLELSGKDFEPARNEEIGGGTWYVSFRQTYRGLPVDGGSVRLVVRDGAITSIASSFFPGIDLPAEPAVPLDSALAAAGLAKPAGVEKAPVSSRLIVYPQRHWQGLTYTLAWDVVMPIEKAPRLVADPSAGRVDEDAGRRDELWPVQWRYLIDARSGAVIDRLNLMRYEDVTGTVTGPVRPMTPADAPVTEPFENLNVNVTQGMTTMTGLTDAGGAYTVSGLTAGAGNLEAHFEGPHMRVWNNETPDPDATHAVSLVAPGTESWDWSVDDPSPSQVESNAFYHLNFIRSWFLRGAPFDVSPLPDPMEVFVRDGEYCNAGASSGGLSFGSGSPGSCEDFSLCADIFYHEYTHRVVHKVYDDAAVSLPYSGQTGAMNEGWADYYGSTNIDQPTHGVACYSGRNIDTPDRRFPDDYVGAVHTDGLIFSGALWDLRTVLGATYVDSLALRAMKRAETSFSDYLAAVLEEDDDPTFSTDPVLANNNPADGTPNIVAICHAYSDIHGIFHPYCSNYVEAPVALIETPPFDQFNMFDGSVITVPVTGTALGAASDPLASFTLEWSHQSDVTTWSASGVTVAGGGLVPIVSGSLGSLDITGIADGLVLIRLTVTTAGAATASMTTGIVIDRMLMNGWPQAFGDHMYGSPAVADLDPAAPGLEIAAVAGSTLHVWHTDGTEAPGWPQTSSWTYGDPAVADLDGDGDLEIVVVNPWGRVNVYHQDGVAASGWPLTVADAEFYGTPALGDLDGDGDLEIAATSGDSKVHAWHHDATAVAGWPVTGGDGFFSSPAVGDLDGDGAVEIIAGCDDGSVYGWDGAGLALPGWPVSLAATTDISQSAALGDMDGDGDLEIVVATKDFDDSSLNQVHAWHHNGTTVAGWPKTLPDEFGSFSMSPSSAVLADLDSDGLLEVIVMTNNNKIHIWEPDGTPVAGWPPAGVGGGYYEFVVSSPAVADIDGDGAHEITAEESAKKYDGFSAHLVNALNPDATLVAGWPRILNRYSNPSPAIADIDLDGDVEILAGSDGLFVWDLPHAFGPLSTDWALSRHDNRRTGTHQPNAGLVLLFDTSGSMAWRADGSSPAPVAKQRITAAKAAAIPLVQMLVDYNSNRANLGIATFPSHPALGTCQGEVVTAMTRVNPTTAGTAMTTTIPGLVTENSTPLVAGVETAAAMFGSEALRAVVLLSDGYHNCPSLVSVGSPELDALVELLQQRSIRVFTIGFGKPTDMDHPLLEELASQTTPPSYPGSQFYDVTTPTWDPATWTPETDLQSVYKAILADALDLDTAVDPLGVLASGGTATAAVHLNEHDRQASFYLSWRTADPDRLRLTVRSSDGVEVPATAAGVSWHRGDTYTILRVDRRLLNQPAKVGPAPWQIEISAGSFDAASEHYQYSVLVDSGLRLRAGFDRTSYATGDTMTLTATLTEAGVPLRGLSDVEVRIAAPDDGRGNWLSTNPVSPEELAKIRPDINGEKLPDHVRKGMFLTDIRGLAYPGVRAPRVLRLFDDGTHGDLAADDGIYTNQLSDTSREGVYSFHFRAAGPTVGGNSFDRDRVTETYVAVAVEQAATPLKVARLADGDLVRFAVRVTPKDRFGNFVGPGHLTQLRFTSNQVKITQPPRDLLDGTYEQVVLLPHDVDPKSVDVRVAFADLDMVVNLGSAPASRTRLWGLSLHLGVTDPRGNLNAGFDGDRHLGLDIEYRFRPTWSAVAAIQRSSFDRTGPGDDLDIDSLTLNLKKLFGRGTFYFFATGGLGAYDPDGGSTDFGINLGIGAGANLNPRWTLELGIDVHRVFANPDDLEFGVVKGGVIFNF